MVLLLQFDLSGKEGGIASFLRQRAHLYGEATIGSSVVLDMERKNSLQYLSQQEDLSRDKDWKLAKIFEILAENFCANFFLGFNF